MKLNTKKTQSIIKKWMDNSREKKFLFALKSTPDLQLKYLRKLFEESIENGD